MAKNGQLNHFEVAGANGTFVDATAKIIDNKVVVSSTNLSNPVHVRYGWKDYLEGSLFNKAGLPASSFSTE